MNLFSSMLIMPTMIGTAMMTTMLSNMIMMWFIMEINNFMFISYMIIKMKQKKMIFLYFMIQILSSFMMLFSLMCNYISLTHVNQIILMTALFLKSGIPPLHLWMPIISKFMPWLIILMMLTIQKVAPMMMFYLLNINKMMMIMIMMMTMIIPPLSMINMKSMKMLITYSSINQTGWIIMLIYLKHPFWSMYFTIYSTIMLMITYMLNLTKISNKFFHHSFKKLNLTITIMMMNLASMPPFSFFMFKWFSTFMMIMNSNLKLIIIMLLINSLLMTFIYIKMMMWSLFLNKFEPKMMNNQSKLNLNESFWLIYLTMIPLMMIA